MKNIKLKIFGVRGSAPISHSDYIRYGGNTASFTIRTPENTLIFLDAGTGLKFAEQTLNQEADNIYLLLSHTHADHIVGLGMSNLSKLNYIEMYKNKKLKIVGPSGVRKNLAKFYDGEIIWPVKFEDSIDSHNTMNGIDYEGITEYSQDFQSIRIDGVTTLTLLKGNHPVSGSVVLYRLDFEINGKTKSVAYTTDNEFDYLPSRKLNPDKEDLKSNYLRLIQNTDILIAEAQYTKDDYEMMRGYGHSYPEQIIDLASEANVKQVIITHHDLIKDEELDLRFEKAQKYASLLKNQIILKFAKEGDEITI
ncbi:MAG: hypothetical protein GPJ54_19540 [Candidatus Heimdallarchaeota archaeon]|nr:hypothetical protein [Candidatus Heimdallarchaeota archaeon]